MTTTPYNPPGSDRYMIPGSNTEPYITHQELLTILEERDCDKCPLYKWLDAKGEDEDTNCFIIHRLKTEDER